MDIFTSTWQEFILILVFLSFVRTILQPILTINRANGTEGYAKMFLLSRCSFSILKRSLSYTMAFDQKFKFLDFSPELFTDNVNAQAQ